MHSNLIDDLAKRESEVILIWKLFLKYNKTFKFKFFFLKIKFHTKFIDLHKFSHSFISHLSLKQSLKEHEGCVNTLDWNCKNLELITYKK